MERIDPNRIPVYQQGAEGFIAFVEENVRFSVPQRNSPIPKWIYPCNLPDEPDPVTGKSFKQMWEAQKAEMREALKMQNNRFVYRLIVFCWPRGEGKSFMVCLVQLWKYFCFPRQLIVFGALSKEQTRFVHYDMIQTVILNSPKLVNVLGKVNIQSKGTYLKNSKGEVTSSFQPISSFSGIVSNITGYTFSEMFDMKDPKFFVQLDGSVRNIINALGTIDSTVSTKEHVLYRLYVGSRDGHDRLTYFSYRSAPNATPDEYWHPFMDKDQLDSYRRKFPPADFDRYFRNTWELESGKLFTTPVVKSIFYFGYKDQSKIIRIDDGTVQHLQKDIQECEIRMDNLDKRKNKKSRRRKAGQKEEIKMQMLEKITHIRKKLIPMNDFYKLFSVAMPKMMTLSELNRLSDVYDTNWSIHAGLDRSDPLAKDPNARTIVTAVAKGLTGSRNNNKVQIEVPSYLYVLVHLAHIESSSLEDIKRELKEVHLEFDGIDTFCSERWGAWDLAPWCEENEIKFEAVFPSYTLQKKAFNELFIVINNSRFKSANILVPGSKEENILEEELKMFDYHPEGKWYGSPQKKENRGVQDDAVFSLAWGMYGGRDYGVQEFRVRKGVSDYGTFIADQRTLGVYNIMGGR